MSEKNPQTITVSATVKNLLNTQEASIYLGQIYTPSGLVRRRRENPTFPQFRQIGRKCLYHTDDLDSFLAGSPAQRPSSEVPVRPEVGADAE
ncbi:MAG: hypothetical protein HQK60_13970 [Deltaproteobacteria bacterium]|nr:hypothetical protein [Deltaproteobacteria bacterium]